MTPGEWDIERIYQAATGRRDRSVIGPRPTRAPAPARPRARRHGRRAITATTDRQVFVRGVALDEAIGRETFPAMLLRLWRGDAATDAEAELMGACLVAAIDHGPLAPSALVARTIASTRARPMSALAGGILTFGELHGAVVTRAMRIVATVPADGSLEAGPTSPSSGARGRSSTAGDRPSMARA